MRIALVHHSVCGYGGMEIVSQRLYYYLTKRGHEVTFFSTSACQGMNVRRVKVLKFNPEIQIPLDKVNGDYEVVHALSSLSYFNISVSSMLKGKKVVSFLSVKTLRTHPNLFYRLVGSIYEDYIIKKGLKLANAVTVKNLGDKIKLEKFNANPFLIPDGLDDVYFKPLNEDFRQEVLKRFNLEEGEFALYVGRIHKLKGVDVFIKAIQLSNFKGVIVGSGGEVVGNNVVYAGSLDEQSKIALIDSSCCVVIPSLSDYVEAFSIVASEAWARGKPVIASSVGALKYRVKEGVNGFLFKPGDYKALAGILSKAKGFKVKEIPEDVLPWEKVVDMYENVYKKTLENSEMRG
ncbi:group 1 glycosyl transferase [Acidianus hospitalis]|uniref:Group 1 glycosyl transferase n=1 Tax=Acidianus hospitalis TaxID=563177 RepID=A0A2T9X9R6_9CREN|nr:group 1 glycosyl transferase [Acidianus hospitalis]